MDRDDTLTEVAVNEIPSLGRWRTNPPWDSVGPEAPLRDDPEQASAPSVSVAKALPQHRMRLVVRIVLSVVTGLLLIGVGVLARNDAGAQHALSSTRKSLASVRGSLTSAEHSLGHARSQASALRTQLSVALKEAAVARAAEAQQEAEVTAIAAAQQLYAAEDRYAQCLTAHKSLAPSSPSTCPTTGLDPAEVQQISQRVLGSP